MMLLDQQEEAAAGSLRILNLVYEAVIAARTMAGDNVLKPGDRPTQENQYPIVKLRLVAEDRQSIGRSGPAEFTTTATIRLTAEVSEPAQVNNGGAEAAEVSLWQLKREIDRAVVGSYPLSREIQQIAAMRAQLAFTSEAATHLAGIQIDALIEFYEGPESFAPVEADELEQVDLATTNHPPTGFTAPLQQ